MARNLDHILVIDVEATCWQAEPLEGTHHRAGVDAWNGVWRWHRRAQANRTAPPDRCLHLLAGQWSISTPVAACSQRGGGKPSANQ